MTREKKLDILSNIKFELIDPLSEWEDIGFTEREIWVNSKGYGYISCDEPTAWCEVPKINEYQWNNIIKKLSNSSLQMSDIEGTSIENIIEELSYNEIDDDNLCDYLQGLLGLSNRKIDSIYCMDSIDGWQFFATEAEFKKAFERDDCDYAWTDLDDDTLECWINRLTDLEIL